MSMKIIKDQTRLIMLTILLIPTSLPAKNYLKLPDLDKLRPMNGIDPGPLDRFWAKWNLVTTRLRKDNEEQRFIYANKLAYDAMKDGALIFPDGSMFGKLAYSTKADPQFPNSYEPVNFTRLQIMVKNKEKFKKTDGWSYYIYVDGVSHSQKDDVRKNLACHACHTLVKDRDFVFSAPTFLEGKGTDYAKIGKDFKDLFKKIDLKYLPPLESEIFSLFRSAPKQVMVRRMRLFSGSLYESIGPLYSYVSQTGLPFAIIDPVGRRFLAAELLQSPKMACSTDVVKVYLSFKTKGEAKIKQGLVCNGKNRWVKTINTPKKILQSF